MAKLIKSFDNMPKSTDKLAENSGTTKVDDSLYLSKISSHNRSFAWKNAIGNDLKLSKGIFVLFVLI